MQYQHTLRFRVFISYTVLGFLISLFMTVFILLAIEALERQFMNSVLFEELNYFIDRSDKDPSITHQKSKNWVIYKVENQKMPQNMAFLSDYPAGNYDIVYNGQLYDLGVMKRNNIFYYILYNDAQFESLEHKIIYFLIAGCFIILCLTIWYALSLSRRVLDPIINLASEVKKLDPGNTSDYLAPNYANDEVGALALEFDAFHDRLQSLIRREREFTGNVSHELRTPLAVIAATSENLSLQKNLTAPVQKKISRISRSANEMSERLNVLLTLSREQEKNETQITKTLLYPIIEQLIIDFQPLLAPKVKVIRELQTSSWVEAPDAIVAMLMGNLIKNAFTYTRTGVITITLSSSHFSVMDTGCGIATKDIIKVSDRGFKGSNSQGNGYGLDISKRICERYNWHLEIKSRVDHGTCANWIFLK